MTRSLAVIASVGALSMACSKTPPEPKPAPETTTATPVASTSAASKPSGEDIAYEPPASWQQLPNPNTMRKATFKVPRAAGDSADGELTLSAALGGVDKNIERWQMQFAGATAARETKKVHDLDITIVTIKGRYAGGGPMMGGMGAAMGGDAAAAAGPKEGYMLLGAIVEDPNHSNAQQHFFKLVGPEKTVTAAKPDFEKLVSTIRAK